MATETLTKTRPQRRRLPAKEQVTFEQFCDLIHENQKADLIEGVIYLQSPASILHELVFGFLFLEELPDHLETAMQVLDISSSNG